MNTKTLHQFRTDAASDIVADVLSTAQDRLTAAQVALMDCPEKSPIRRIEAILRIHKARASVARALDSLHEDLYRL